MTVGFFLAGLAGLGDDKGRFWRSFGVDELRMTVAFDSRLSDDDVWAGSRVDEIEGRVEVEV